MESVLLLPDGMALIVRNAFGVLSETEKVSVLPSVNPNSTEFGLSSFQKARTRFVEEPSSAELDTVAGLFEFATKVSPLKLACSWFFKTVSWFFVSV